jgi:hypothetical protein
VRLHPRLNEGHGGVIVDDYGDSAGHAVAVGNVQISGPSRRWAVELDDGRLIFADSADLQRESTDKLP